MLSWGDDDGVEDGEEGPNEDGGMTVWGDGAKDAGADGMSADTTVEGEDSRVENCFGELGGVISERFREKRFDVPTDNPLSCSALSRSAMVPPGWLVGSAASGLLKRVMINSCVVTDRRTVETFQMT